MVRCCVWLANGVTWRDQMQGTYFKERSKFFLSSCRARSRLWRSSNISRNVQRNDESKMRCGTWSSIKLLEAFEMKCAFTRSHARLATAEKRVWHKLRIGLSRTNLLETSTKFAEREVTIFQNRLQGQRWRFYFLFFLLCAACVPRRSRAEPFSQRNRWKDGLPNFST